MRRLHRMIPALTLFLLAFTPASPAPTTIDLNSASSADVVLFGMESDDFFGTDLATGDDQCPISPTIFNLKRFESGENNVSAYGPRIIG